MIDKKDEIEICTTICITTRTRERLHKRKGRGISYDRFINDMLDLFEFDEKFNETKVEND